MAGTPDCEVVVVGGGVVGSAVALCLARRGAAVVLLEAEAGLALQASGTNSGILHTGFDSTPGELETQLILRSAELRDPRARRARGPGAALRRACSLPQDDAGRATVARARARRRAQRRDACCATTRALLEVPGESVTDPVAYTLALAGSAIAAGARVVVDAPGRRARGRRRRPDRRARRLVVAAATLVPGGRQLRGPARRRCRRPRGRRDVPRSTRARASSSSSTRRTAWRCGASGCRCPRRATKGVIVFPTLDGKVVAGPTAHDQDDKNDWSVRAGAEGEIRAKVAGCCPSLASVEPRRELRGAAAGRASASNYVIGHSGDAARARPRRGDPLDRADARRSGIAEYVSGLVGELGVPLGGAGAAASGSASARPSARRAVVGANGALRGGAGDMSAGPLLLGIDEGTTAVKAALFDARAASRSGRRARRIVGVTHPQPGWVEKDPARGPARRWSTRSTRCSRDAPRPGRRLRSGPRGRVGAGVGRA